ncbi:hypothetical protein [Cellvibrio japonicus]|uniref:Transmembrane protein n=1 Tax=Cellvibrio japonicus (strain Ueda107) TaxID=498211 RepID=B3PJ27_CELJU|nr:hypothetical protein [Cellvibrio japonicus]ACE85438.1 hypothetical protein CJA_0538 [Cellvibrio japonicus Ueda107]QEI11227.1 hypothetical protein FY117_02585 [Cellvibrio japonicus]QEI14801.1 hypothetical protein FY116_02585 [Cellvibrio japonicus]QEI18381.1 hypothetical protein FY115_02585 [Cellvibrio japonicus]
MLDFSTPYAWLWLVSVVLLCVALFKRDAPLFLAVTLPAIVAMKYDIHSLIIAAGVSVALAAVVLGTFLTVNKKDHRTSPLTDEETGHSVTFRLRVAFWIAVPLVFLLNIALALLVLQLADPDTWFEQYPLMDEFRVMAYLVISFISALCLFTLFVTTEKNA